MGILLWVPISYIIVAMCHDGTATPTGSETTPISLPEIVDQSNEDICIAYLHCFLSQNFPQIVTVSFNLTLDKAATDWIFNVTLETLLDESPLVDIKANLCYEVKSEEAYLSKDPCDNSAVPARTQSYSLKQRVEVPFFKDLALLDVKGPNDIWTGRTLVSPFSSYPPAQPAAV